MEGGNEDYCVCLLEHHKTAAKLPGLTAFPGDLVQSMDFAIAHDLSSEVKSDFAVGLRVAAMRAAFAETGVVLAEPAPPDVLRHPTRDALLRNGPRTILDCMIAWNGGRPRPNLNLCSMEHMASFKTSSERVTGLQSAEAHFFISKIPDAYELEWMLPATNDTTILWLEPLQVLQLCRAGKLRMPAPELVIIEQLQQRLSSLHELPSLLADGPCFRSFELPSPPADHLQGPNVQNQQPSRL